MPKLGQYFKKLIYASGFADNITMDVADFTDTEYVRCIRFLEDKELAFDDRVLDWKDEIEDGGWEALFSLLICLTPALKKLTLFNHGKGGSWGYLDKVLRIAASLQSQNQDIHCLCHS